VATLVVGLVGLAGEARADFPPSRPITFWNDRVIVSGEFSFTFGNRDEGYFNAIDYYHDALNVMRAGISIECKVAGNRVTVLGQVIDQVALREDGESDFETPWEPFDTNRHVVRPYALFVRVRPWLDKPVTIQAGRIPPVFGAYVRADYGVSQPLISLPLAYHYPTTMRTDAIPRSAVGVSRWRGSGWRARYGAGALGWGQGTPLINALRWDTGVQLQVGDGPVEVSGAVTQGSLGDPRFEDNNDGKQISGRVAVRPVAGFVAGVSGARGEYFSRSLIADLPETLRGRTYAQRAFGADAEYSRGYWLVRTETVISWWDVPQINEPFIASPLRAWGSWVEGRWKLSPRWYIAARADHLGFSTIDAGPDNGGVQAWDGPVTRVEFGGGYSVLRNVRVKAAYQYDWRDAGFMRKRGALATQVVYWF
jgi:hypothetical protein